MASVWKTFLINLFVEPQSSKTISFLMVQGVGTILVLSVNYIGLFKNKLLSLIRPLKKSFFNLHNPTEIKILFRLRMGLGELKDHKNAHHFIDTPFATFEFGVEPEDSMHSD